MTAYVDFAYYSGTFLGTQISEADFPALALHASAFIDLVTFDRAADVITAGTDTALIDKIKMATCNVAETLQTNNAAEGLDGIQSESIGRYSVTFNSNSSKQQTSGEKMHASAALYLGNTGLMFSGFTEDEWVA